MQFRELSDASYAACLNVGEKVKGSARRLLVAGCTLVVYRPGDRYDPTGRAAHAIDHGRALADTIIREVFE